MNGISNGDGTYKQLSNSDALVGMASDLPNPQKSVTENIGSIFKYKDYSKADTYLANERGTIVNLDTDGISGYTAVSCSCITTERTSIDLIPFIANINGSTRLMVHNVSGANITKAEGRVYRVWFVNSIFIKA